MTLQIFDSTITGTSELALSLGNGEVYVICDVGVWCLWAAPVLEVELLLPKVV